MPGQPVLIVCGSRVFNRYILLATTLDAVVWPRGSSRPVYPELWHGGSSGADALAHRWSVRRGLPRQVWPADWSLGRSAGVRRSAEMVAAAPAGSVVVAFVPTKLADCVGTSHTVRLALGRGLRVIVVDSAGQRVLDPAPFLVS